MKIRKKVLIVDDEYIIAIDLKQRLEQIGYDVSSIVNSADKAIEQCRKDLPDLVLMDIIIKGDMDGIEASGIIQNLFNIPVVFITASSDSITLRKIMSRSSFGYIHKPITDVDLKYTLQQSIQMYEIFKELEIKKKLNGNMSEIILESITDLNHPALLVNRKNEVLSHSMFFCDIKNNTLKNAFNKLKLGKKDEETIISEIKNMKDEPADISLSSRFRCRMLPVGKGIFLELKQS